MKIKTPLKLDFIVSSVQAFKVNFSTLSLKIFLWLIFVSQRPDKFSSLIHRTQPKDPAHAWPMTGIPEANL